MARKNKIFQIEKKFAKNKMRKMKNLAPEICRQRFLLEGFFEIAVDKKIIEKFFREIAAKLSLKIYSDPIIFSPGGAGKKENQGFDAFVPLVDSGISIYIWSDAKFLSLIIYTCKKFDEKIARDFTKKFFCCAKIESQSF